MQTDKERLKLRYGDTGFGARAPSLLARVLGVAAGALLLIGAVAISIVLFVIALTALLVFGIYLWWRTRELRKQMRASSPDANVIEGEVIRETRPDSKKGP